MASVGREPEGLSKDIPRAITDPRDEPNTASVECAITTEHVVGNGPIHGTITSPAGTGKHSQGDA